MSVHSVSIRTHAEHSSMFDWKEAMSGSSLTALLAFISTYFAIQVNETVPEPYMVHMPGFGYVDICIEGE